MLTIDSGCNARIHEPGQTKQYSGRFGVDYTCGIPFHRMLLNGDLAGEQDNFICVVTNISREGKVTRFCKRSAMECYGMQDSESGPFCQF